MKKIVLLFCVFCLACLPFTAIAGKLDSKLGKELAGKSGAPPLDSVSEEEMKAEQCQGAACPDINLKTFSPGSDIGEDKAIHGFFMFGTNKLVLYHSSVFRPLSNPHRYQMYLIASIDKMDLYTADVAKYGVKDYIWLVHNDNKEPWNSEEFTLPELKQKVEDNGSYSFRSGLGRLKKGPDSGGYSHDNAYPGVVFTVTINKVMKLRAFNIHDKYNDNPTYRIFGRKDSPLEVFMAHYLTKKSDYDDVVQITVFQTAGQPSSVATYNPTADDIQRTFLATFRMREFPPRTLPSQSPIKDRQNYFPYLGNGDVISLSSIDYYATPFRWFDTGIND